MTDGRCPGCGVVRPELDRETHPYVGASAACWMEFGEINWALPPTAFGRLMIDAYVIQHPGRLEPPEPNGEPAIFDVAAALGTDDAPDACERYVRSIWAAWASHQDTVEAWAKPFNP